MMLPAPRLDDRAFQDLVDDAKRLVMRRCPEWTDHNVSDPGVTVIETFALMTDAMLYRLNRVPDRLYVKFLDMIGLRMIPPAAARVPVTFWLATPPEVPYTVPVGTAVATPGSDAATSLVFSTVEPLELMPTVQEGLVTAPMGAEVADRTSALELESPVAAFSDRPVPGDVMYVGLDRAAPSCAVRLDVVARTQGIGVNPKAPPLVWEALGDPDGPENTDDVWEECDATDDTTGGLNRSGSLVLHLPREHRVGVVAGRGAAWLRARVVEPEPGQPPYSQSPVIDRLTACTVGGTVGAVHAEVVAEETLGESEGVPGQRFRVLHSPVLAGAGEPAIEVSSIEGWQRWERVEHFAQSTADDRHVVLDAFAGEVVFGPMVRLEDGGVRQYGAVPGQGATVRIRDYAFGGGPDGNVAAHTITTMRSSLHFVSDLTNRQPATGGTAGETLQEAVQRGPLLLRTRDRAVTAEDYELLAREAVPDAARVHCVPADGVTVPAGTVKVLVVPAASAERHRVALADLIPSQDVLARVADRLEQTRIAGIRVLLEPPRYRGVTVVARLVARPRVRGARVEKEALDALYRLLNPLPGGGPDGRGWPFGRPVQTGELFAVLREVRGVELVEDLRLFSADPISGRRGAEAQRIDLDQHSLVFSFEHLVKVEEH